ncbi:MAG TPA: hypothetical protein VJB89_02895 [Candidatus Nanoarchaeia archaeon]|nr:hypothetical protein [Candidatus Nanoarchaeia archaeon]
MYKKGAVALLIYGLPVLIIIAITFLSFSIYFSTFGGLTINSFAAPETEEQIFTLTSLLETKVSAEPFFTEPIAVKELLIEAQKNSNLEAQSRLLSLLEKTPHRPGFTNNLDRSKLELHWQLKVTDYNLKEKSESNIKIYGDTLIFSGTEINHKKLYFPTNNPNIITIINLYEVYKDE